MLLPRRTKELTSREAQESWTRDFILDRGADINAVPPGFHHPGTAVHSAAVNGHASMCEFLVERGADASARDLKNGGSPAGWVAYGGHPDLSEYLEAKAKAQTESEEP